MKVQPDDIVIRTLPRDEGKKKTKRSRISRLGAGVAAMAIASVSLFTGFAFTPTGSATTVAFAEEDGGLFDDFFGGIVDAFNPCMNPDMKDLPGIREYSGDTRNLGPNADYYTAYEWYGSGATNSWENYTWDEVGGGCYLTLQGFNVIPNLMLSTQNNIATGVVIPSISWISGINLIDLFFLNPDSVVQQMVTELNRVFYSEYLLVIIALSAISLIWYGLVKKRFRDSIGDLIWVITAAAAGTLFLANPTLIAGWMDKGVYAVQTTIISSATQAGSFASDARCQVENVAVDYEVSPQVRTMQCALWDSFVFQPWAEGQMGKAAQSDFTVDGAQSTFRGSNEGSLLLLDVRTYNRMDVASGATTNSSKSALDDRKQEQWDALGNAIVNSEAAEIGYPYWTGEAWVERITIATGAMAAKLFAFVPVVWLSFGMLGQQVIFVLLMIVAPFFLLAGVFPQARRFALGWLEMVLSTAVKRVVYAVLIGLLFLWFAAVSSTTIPAGLLGTIVGVNIEVLLMAMGAVVIMVIQRKAIKRAGDAIRLGGERITDGGRAREFFAMTGSAVASGLGAKSAGGSFSQGFGEKFSVPGVSNNSVVRSFTSSSKRVGDEKRAAAQERAKGTSSIAGEILDIPASETGAPSTSTPSGSSPRPAPRPAGKDASVVAATTAVTAGTVGAAVKKGNSGEASTSGAQSGSTPRPSRSGSSNAGSSVSASDIAAQVTPQVSVQPTSQAPVPSGASSETTVENNVPSRPRSSEQLRRSSEQNIQAVQEATEEKKSEEATSQPQRPKKPEATAVAATPKIDDIVFAQAEAKGSVSNPGTTSAPRRPSRPEKQGE